MRCIIIAILAFFTSEIRVHGNEAASSVRMGGTLMTLLPEEGHSQSEVPGRIPLDRYISFTWENDLYFQRDCYFTNGFQLDYFHSKLNQSPINRILIPLRKPGEGITWSGLQLRQEIFTPKDLAADTISLGDHPYSSTLTIAQVRILNLPTRKMRIVSGLRVGVLGPASMGYKTQELAHLVSNPSRPPQGWDYQVHNDLIVNYDIQLEKGFSFNKSTLLGFRGKGRLGTLHTDLETGIWFGFDARNGYFKRLGPMGGPGLNLKFSLAASATYVFYDATLQGGVFNRSSPYILAPGSLFRWVGNLKGSLTLEWYRHQMEIYTQVSSPRFRQAEPHGWIGLTYRYWF